jgi:hypothetical protein
MTKEECYRGQSADHPEADRASGHANKPAGNKIITTPPMRSLSVSFPPNTMHARTPQCARTHVEDGEVGKDLAGAVVMKRGAGYDPPTLGTERHAAPRESRLAVAAVVALIEHDAVPLSVEQLVVTCTPIPPHEWATTKQTGRRTNVNERANERVHD